MFNPPYCTVYNILYSMFWELYPHLDCKEFSPKPIPIPRQGAIISKTLATQKSK